MEHAEKAHRVRRRWGSAAMVSKVCAVARNRMAYSFLIFDRNWLQSASVVANTTWKY